MPSNAPDKDVDAKGAGGDTPGSGTADPPKSGAATKPEPESNTDPTPTTPSPEHQGTTVATTEVTTMPTATTTPLTTVSAPAPDVPKTTRDGLDGKPVDPSSKPSTVTVADEPKQADELKPPTDAAPAEPIGKPVVEEPEPNAGTRTAAGPVLDQARAALGEDATVPAQVPVQVAFMAARAVSVAAPEVKPPAGPSLINVLGTIAFGLFDFFNKIIAGPPVVPAGSTVRVGRSTLQIDCGDGYTADADWYFPTGPGPPTRLIYFQHGVGAGAGYYNATAAELAERNNAIVVAPTITSNLFACDGCQLSGDQMHAAVAKLFLDEDRAALLQSAKAAGFEGTRLPQRFVLSGHSEGGQLAAGAAGYFEQRALDDEARHELVGVLLFDTQDSNGFFPSTAGALRRGLGKIPKDIPVLNIAATAYGNASVALEDLRPGQFNGVQLIGGAHSDAFRTSNPLIQFVVSLGTGFSTPDNVEAVEVLAQGWINDMYAGTVYDPDRRTGIYGDPAEIVDIPTTGANAYVLPAPAARPDLLYPFYLVLSTLLRFAGNVDFATCAPADESAAAVTAVYTKCSAQL